jgi:hypothetical protein
MSKLYAGPSWNGANPGAKPLFEHHIYGPSNGGKTVGMLGLLQAQLEATNPNEGLTTGRVSAFWLSEQTRVQRGRLLAGQEPNKCLEDVVAAAPLAEGELPPSARERIARLPAKAEWAFLSRTDCDELFCTHVGQKLPEADQLVSEFAGNPNKLFIAGLNPILHSRNLTRRGYLDLTLRLQAMHPGVTLSDAAVHSANLLFHSHPELPGRDSPSTNGSTHELQRLTAADLTLLAPKFARITSDTATRLRLVRTPEGMVTQGGLALENREALEALLAVADRFYGTNEQTEYRQTLPLVLSRLPRSLVVLSHTDLFRQSPEISRWDFDEVLDRLYGTGDRLLSQQVLGGFLSRSVEYDDTTRALRLGPVSLRTDTGQQMYLAISKQQLRPVGLPTMSDLDRVGYGYFAREVVYRSVGAIAGVLAAVLTTELLAGAAGRWVSSPWSQPWQLLLVYPAGVVLLVALLVWLRLQRGLPAWTVDGRQGEPVARFRGFGGTLEVTGRRVVLRQTWLGRLLGFGTATCEGNTVRAFTVPVVGRLLAYLHRRPAEVSLLWWKDAGFVALIVCLMLLWAVGAATDYSALAMAFRVLAAAAALWTVFSPYELRDSSAAARRPRNSGTK